MVCVLNGIQQYIKYGNLFVQVADKSSPAGGMLFGMSGLLLLLLLSGRQPRYYHQLHIVDL